MDGLIPAKFIEKASIRFDCENCLKKLSKIEQAAHEVLSAAETSY